jgi:hypothetical protein
LSDALGARERRADIRSSGGREEERTAGMRFLHALQSQVLTALRLTVCFQKKWFRRAARSLEPHLSPAAMGEDTTPDLTLFY